MSGLFNTWVKVSVNRQNHLDDPHSVIVHTYMLPTSFAIKQTVRTGTLQNTRSVPAVSFNYNQSNMHRLLQPKKNLFLLKLYGRARTYLFIQKLFVEVCE